MGFQNPFNIVDKVTFFKKFIQSPTQIGSVAPSSRFLAERMLAPIDWSRANAIAELGAGTGAFTKHIARNKGQWCQVLVFEKDKEMRKHLSRQYPEFQYCDDAIHLSEKVKTSGIQSLDTVISGLPFALFAEPVREQIVSEVIQSLQPEGLFITFQYSLQMKEMLLEKFSRVEISYVPLNLPPAFVYVCHK